MLVVINNGEILIREGIGIYFELKEDSLGPTKAYLGGNVQNPDLKNGAMEWTFISSQYV